MKVFKDSAINGVFIVEFTPAELARVKMAARTHGDGTPRAWLHGWVKSVLEDDVSEARLTNAPPVKRAGKRFPVEQKKGTP